MIKFGSYIKDLFVDESFYLRTVLCKDCFNSDVELGFGLNFLFVDVIEFFKDFLAVFELVILYDALRSLVESTSEIELLENLLLSVFIKVFKI